MSITRYYRDHNRELFEDPDGDWMRYEDHLAEVKQARGTGSFHKANHLAAEAEVERLTAREKELTGALRPLHEAACRIWDAIIAAVEEDKLDTDAVLDWLAVPSDRANAALVAGKERYTTERYIEEEVPERE